MSYTAPPPAPAAIVVARGALSGLGALLNCVDPGAWASLARPDPAALGQLLTAIRDKYDEGLSDLGLEPQAADPAGRPS